MRMRTKSELIKVHSLSKIRIDKRIENLQREMERITGKKIRIPRTKFIDFISCQETVYPDEFKNFLRRKI